MTAWLSVSLELLLNLAIAKTGRGSSPTVNGFSGHDDANLRFSLPVSQQCRLAGNRHPTLLASPIRH